MTEAGYSAPAEIRFGAGASAGLGELAARHGRIAAFITVDEGRHADLLGMLEDGAGGLTVIRHRGEPSVADAEAAAERVRDAGCECLFAIGGGSVIDLAKAAAALAANGGGALRYLEVVGEGRPLERDPLPVVAVPTTFGTGSEATRNAVLSVPEHRRKVSLRDPRMVPKVAVVDPDLAKGLPPRVAASAGIDALIHVCEAYVGASPCAALDARSRAAIEAGFRSLPCMVMDPSDHCREAMAEVSLCGGLCIANSRLGAVHGLAGVIGGLGTAGHGAICGALFAAAFEANLAAMPLEHPSRARFAEIAELAQPGAGAENLPELISELSSTIGLARLGELGVPAAQHAELAEASQKSSSMRGNPVELSVAQLEGLLERAH